MTESPDRQFIPSRQPFESLAIVASYRVLDPGSVKHQIELHAHVRALQQARFYQRRCRWTGQGIEQRPRIVGGAEGQKHRIHGPVLRDGQDLIFLVDLGRDLAVGEDIWVRTSQLFIDRAGTALPHLRHAVRHPLGRLELRAYLPAELAQYVRFEIRDINADERIAAPDPLEVSAEGYFVIVVDQPTPGLEYRVAWLAP